MLRRSTILFATMLASATIGCKNPGASATSPADLSSAAGGGAGGGGGGGTGGGGGAGGGGGTTGGPADLAMTPTQDGGGDCNSIANAAPVVQQTMVNQPMPSPSMGGVIASGTYYLTDSKIYQGAPPGVVPLQLQITQVISGSNAQTVQRVNNAANSQRDARTYATNGTTLTLTIMCPAAASGTLGYDYIGNQLITYNSAAKTVNVWTKQ